MLDFSSHASATLTTTLRYSSLLSALGGPVIPSSPADAVALVSHLSSMRNDASRLRAAAAVVAAGGLTASGHLRVLEAAACAGTTHCSALPPSYAAHHSTISADAFRNAPVSSPRDIEDCLLEWLCYCQAHFSESIGGTLPSLLANDDLLLDCAGTLSLLLRSFPLMHSSRTPPSLPPNSLSFPRWNRNILRPCCARAMDQAYAQAHYHAAENAIRPLVQSSHCTGSLR